MKIEPLLCSRVHREHPKVRSPRVRSHRWPPRVLVQPSATGLQRSLSRMPVQLVTTERAWRNDRAWPPQGPVESSKEPEAIFVDRTRQVTSDRTRPGVRSAPCVCACVNPADVTTDLTHALRVRSCHHAVSHQVTGRVGQARAAYGRSSSLSANAATPAIIDRTRPGWVRSLGGQRPVVNFHLLSFF
jgi:hypothetical protein